MVELFGVYRVESMRLQVDAILSITSEQDKHWPC